MARKGRTASPAAALASAINTAMKAPVLGFASDDKYEVKRVPCGSLTVERITGGGFPRGRHVEIFGDYCVSPDTAILTSDLEWLPAEELKCGNELVGFDEFGPGGRGKKRKLQLSTMGRNNRRVLPCFEITTDKGTKTVASASHGWLTLNKTYKSPMWITSRNLSVGDKILWLGDRWDKPENAEAATYLAGLVDGEGWLSGGRFGFSQNEGVVLDYALELMKKLGFQVHHRSANGNGTGCHGVYVCGGVPEVMRFLGQVKPKRFDNKFWVGKAFTTHGQNGYTDGRDVYATVKKVRYVGEQEVCVFGTSTKTFFADGLCSHNSSGKSFLAYMTMVLAQQRGELCALIDSEGIFDSKWFKKLGGDIDELLIHRPSTAEETIKLLMLLAGPEGADIVTIDSVASLLPNEELNKDPEEGEDRTAGRARMMSRALRRVTTVNDETLFIWTNQVIDKISGYGGITTPGGRALKFYASIRLELKREKKEKRSKQVAKKGKLVATDVPVGQWVMVRAEKQKTARPEMAGMFLFDTENGCIDHEVEIINLGLQDGAITRSGNTFTYIDSEKQPWSGTESRFKKLLIDNDDMREELEWLIGEKTKELTISIEEA
jgi:recombination protein RecA